MVCCGELSEGGAAAPRSPERPQRRRTAEVTRWTTAAAGSRGREGRRGCPGDSHAHPEYGGAASEVGERRSRRQSARRSGGRSWRRWCRSREQGRPGSIPGTGRNGTVRWSCWRHRLVVGRPAATVRCGGRSGKKWRRPGTRVRVPGRDGERGRVTARARAVPSLSTRERGGGLAWRGRGKLHGGMARQWQALWRQGR